MTSAKIVDTASFLDSIQDFSGTMTIIWMSHASDLEPSFFFTVLCYTHDPGSELPNDFIGFNFQMTAVKSELMNVHISIPVLTFWMIQHSICNSINLQTQILGFAKKFQY
jgi:hypothetical protein